MALNFHPLMLTILALLLLSLSSKSNVSAGSIPGVEGLPAADADAMLELWNEMQNISLAGVNANGKQIFKVIRGLNWAIEDPNDPDVVDIGKTAVEEQNNDAGTYLQFVEVISGLRLHVLVFDIYAIVIRVRDGNNTDSEGALTFKAPFRSAKLLLWL